VEKPRILLIKPPERSEFDFGAFSLAALAASVTDRAEVAIFDATHLSCVDAAARTWREAPDIVGVTVMGSGSVPSARRFIEALVDHPARKPVTILAGGQGATATPRPILESGASAVVLGEGETTLRQVLAQGALPGAPGLAFLVDGELRIGPPQPLVEPLDSLPHPARHLMPTPRDGVHLMETSRGCPHLCAFCETTRFHGREWRPHSPARVAEEAARLVEKHDAWVILFADDNFAASGSRVLEICDRLAAGPRPATFMVSARADDLLRDPSIIPALARGRIFRVTVGVETLEEGPASAIGKAIAPALYREVFERLAAHGIFSLASFIVGLPGESDDFRHLLEPAVKAGPDAATFVPFLPMPGTPLAADAVDFAPSPENSRRAEELTEMFHGHPAVRRRLEKAVASGGIRGLMARATLNRRLGKA
jgi:anaerobic magnesium-protoporphyrin IX monomethyl ester cyclase